MCRVHRCQCSEALSAEPGRPAWLHSIDLSGCQAASRTNLVAVSMVVWHWDSCPFEDQSRHRGPCSLHPCLWPFAASCSEPRHCWEQLESYDCLESAVQDDRDLVRMGRRYEALASSGLDTLRMNLASLLRAGRGVKGPHWNRACWMKLAVLDLDLAMTDHPPSGRDRCLFVHLWRSRDNSMRNLLFLWTDIFGSLLAKLLAAASAMPCHAHSRPGWDWGWGWRRMFGTVC